MRFLHNPDHGNDLFHAEGTLQEKCEGAPIRAQDEHLLVIPGSRLREYNCCM